MYSINHLHSNQDRETVYRASLSRSAGRISPEKGSIYKCGGRPDRVDQILPPSTRMGAMCRPRPPFLINPACAAHEVKMETASIHKKELTFSIYI